MDFQELWFRNDDASRYTKMPCVRWRLNPRQRTGNICTGSGWDGVPFPHNTGMGHSQVAIATLPTLSIPSPSFLTFAFTIPSTCPALGWGMELCQPTTTSLFFTPLQEVSGVPRCFILQVSCQQGELSLSITCARAGTASCASFLDCFALKIVVKGH